jgi:DNA primase
MDVIALHQAGFDNAVASLGTALTSGHANLLKRYTKEVYLTYDSDGAGVKAALRAIPILKEVGIVTKIINMQPYKDPDEFIKAMGAEEYQKRIDNAENSFMFEIRIMQKDYDMKDPESKTAFYNDIAKKLLGFSEELERNNYIEAVAGKYNISFDDLRKLVNNLAMKGGVVSKSPQLKSGIHENKKKEDGRNTSQKLLLTWLIEDTRLFGKVSSLISPDDFTEELYHKVAATLFEQFKTEGTVNPAKIISSFMDEEEQKEVAGLFTARIHEVETQNEMEKALKETDGCKTVIVDFHAEATAEKRAMGFFLDGKVTAVLGTHTHVQTADEQLLPKGTAYITDVGMTGPVQSVLGIEPELTIKKFRSNLPVRFQNAGGEYSMNGCIIEIDEKTGESVSIERVDIR